VAREQDDARTAFAAFLMGETTQLPADLLSAAPLRLQALLHLNRLRQAWQGDRFAELYHAIGWEGDRTRCQLLLAEVARRQGALSREYLESASRWAIHSGSVEHLCLFHLVRARAAKDLRDSESAQRAVDEGLHMARQCGLVLYAIELLCVQAELSLTRLDAVAAEHFAAAGWERALAADCQYLWGAAQAGHLLGRALLAQGKLAGARPVLLRALSVRQRIGDPRSEETERLLESLRL
jgi:hypothetical protein